MIALVNVGYIALTAAAPIEITATPAPRRSELLPREEVEKMGVVWRGNATSVSSHDLLPELSDCERPHVGSGRALVA